jgi:hypothetical protein
MEALAICIAIYLINMVCNDYLDEHPDKPGLKNFLASVRVRQSR